MGQKKDRLFQAINLIQFGDLSPAGFAEIAINQTLHIITNHDLYHNVHIHIHKESMYTYLYLHTY